MNWTKEKPTKEGWYWYGSDVSDPKPTILWVDIMNNGQGWVSWPDHSSDRLTRVEGEWYGPLKLPEDEETETFAALWSTFWDSLVIGDGDYDMEAARKLCKLAGLEVPI